jgi:hypothetical protein
MESPARLSFFVSVFVAWLGIAAPSSAQDIQEPLPARVIGTGEVDLVVFDGGQYDDRLRELKRWMTDFDKWKQWNQQWRNTRQQGWLKTRPRRERPDPPAWLAGACDGGFMDESGILPDACRTLAEWRDDEETAQLRAQMAAARAQHEAPTKTVWWEHVHLDAMWPVAQTGNSVFGVLGMHATVDIAGRFQVFVAPGAILLSLPNGPDSRELRPAVDWGIAYRCFDFTFPGIERRASLHINLARAWVMSGPTNAFKTNVDLVGFSLTFKKP